jgi:ribosomal protein S18 acetylase RimI-like enzyme
VEIRSADVADLDEIVDLWSREGGPTSLPGGLDEARALLEHDGDALVIARVDDALAGCLIVGWDGWRCHLYRLVVEPSWRRSGIASRLVAEAITRARALGARKIDATVAFENNSAIAFWEGQEFLQDPRDGRWSLRF